MGDPRLLRGRCCVVVRPTYDEGDAPRRLHFGPTFPPLFISQSWKHPGERYFKHFPFPVGGAIAQPVYGATTMRHSPATLASQES